MPAHTRTAHLALEVRPTTDPEPDPGCMSAPHARSGSGGRRRRERNGFGDQHTPGESPLTGADLFAMKSQLTVLYDADCGICTHTARLLARLDTRRRLRLVALQEANLPGQPPVEVLSEALHVADTDGRWFVGGRAMVEITRRIPALRPISLYARLPLADLVFETIYRAIATNRQQISRLFGLKTCQVRSRV